MAQQLYSPAKILYISLSDIDMPPAYRRRTWTEEDDELVRSIARYGVLLPVILRKNGGKFEMISGTRRFYACRRAGMSSIPAVILDITSPEGELIALTENHNRKTLDYIEEAEELLRIITSHGISQEEAARRIGKSPSAVSNKLRLLNMPKELLYAARDAGLTERHVRALLRLPGSRAIAAAMQYVIDNDLSVSETENYIENILHPKKESIMALGNTGLFLNTVYRGADMMKKSGYAVSIDKHESDMNIEINITLSKLPLLC